MIDGKNEYFKCNKSNSFLAYYYTFDDFVVEPIIKLSNNDTLCPLYSYDIFLLEKLSFDNKINLNNLINYNISENHEKFSF
jgi:hypothetical protein